MTNKKEVAHKIMEAFYEDWSDDEHSDDPIAVVNVLREVINQLQYDKSDWNEPTDHMVIDVRDILKVCEELENL